MIKILFVCHGNICRSPLAEFILKSYINKYNLNNILYVESRATSSEEIGNSIHYGSRKILDKYNIDYSQKRASKITLDDINEYDYIYYMDDYNYYNLVRLFGNNDKFIKLLSKDIEDPWYTNNFNKVEKEINEGIEEILKKFNLL